MPAIALREVIELALRSESELLAAVAADICAVQDRDPAVDLSHPAALPQRDSMLFRGIGWPTGCGVRDAVPGALSAKPDLRGVRRDVHPAARIGKGIMFDHATGIVSGKPPSSRTTSPSFRV